MKHWFLVLIALALVTIPAWALDDIVMPKGGSFYDGTSLQPREDSATGTTVSSTYTPRFVGDWLLGKTDGSNSVWIARGLTTNDWSLVDGNGGDFGADDLQADCVTEAKLKAVDTPSDEDVLTYESTTGDFEWHSVNEIAAKITTGILGSSLSAGNIAIARMTNALESGGGYIGGNIPIASLTNAAASLGSALGGNIPVASMSNAFTATFMPAYSAGTFYVVDTTQLVFIAGAVTNVIDADITN